MTFDLMVVHTKRCQSWCLYRALSTCAENSSPLLEFCCILPSWHTNRFYHTLPVTNTTSIWSSYTQMTHLLAFQSWTCNMDQWGIKYPLASGRWEGRRLRLEGSAVEPAKHRWRTTWFLLKHLTWLASTRPKPKSFNCHIKFWHFWTPSTSTYIVALYYSIDLYWFMYHVLYMACFNR